MDQTPWWAAGLFTLLGVAAASLGTLLINKSSAKRDDSRRWHEDRKRLYLDVTHQMMQVQRSYFDLFELGEELPPDLDQRIEDLWECVREVSLIGSREVVEQTRHVMSEISAAGASACLDQPGKTLNHCDNIRHSLYLLQDMARADLTADARDLKRWKHVTLLSHWSPKQKEKVARMYPPSESS